MITFLHDKLKGLLLLLLAIVGVSFIFFGNWTPQGGMDPASQVLGKVNGKSLNLNEFVAAQRQALLEITLQTGRIPSAEQNDFLNFQTWIRLLQVQAADRAQIDAQPAEIIEAIQKNPLFQKDNAYDPELFQRFNANFLSPQGFSGERFNQAVLDSIRTDTLLRALASTAFVLPEESEKRLQRLFGPVRAQVVRWNPSKITPPEPKPEDLESFYKANPKEFEIPARRTVDVVEFVASGTSEEERTKAGETAFTFTSQFFNLAEGVDRPSFTNRASAAKLTVRTHGPFTATETPFPGESDAKLTAAAFALSPEEPVSDYLPSKKGFLVLHLREEQPGRLRPLSEITSEVRARWQEQARLQMAMQMAQSFVQKANAALPQGQKWEEIVKSYGLTSAALPTFSPAEEKPLTFPDADRIRSIVTQLEPGRVSSPIRTQKDFLVVYLSQRDAAPATAISTTLPRISAQLLNQRRGEIIRDWLAGQAALPENQLPPEVLSQLRGSL
ncbi:MAG: peptidylprolyl isomerase [Verrucomicrobia bacterium]|nr:peptidylprolyl isomerase [Verrucomicrobiota bacterium]MDA0858019.1 peptidylprolyl isomerase [Verrucomicrobiota bacterium]